VQVIGAAWYWYSWRDTDYDRLAGALIAGHLIECSSYVTGSNFAGFYEYPLDDLYDITFGIAEVERDGTCVITKHDKKNGFVTEDTVKCQFLYELQGNIYLNSDVKAILDNVRIKTVSKNRYAKFRPSHVSLDTLICMLTILKSASLGYKRCTSATNHKTSYLLPRGLPIRDCGQLDRLCDIREI
jgi:hypothetical protein